MLSLHTGIVHSNPIDAMTSQDFNLVSDAVSSQREYSQRSSLYPAKVEM